MTEQIRILFSFVSIRDKNVVAAVFKEFPTFEQLQDRAYKLWLLFDVDNRTIWHTFCEQCPTFLIRQRIGKNEWTFLSILDQSSLDAALSGSQLLTVKYDCTLIVQYKARNSCIHHAIRHEHAALKPHLLFDHPTPGKWNH